MTWASIIIFTIIVCVIAGVAEYRAQHELPFTDPIQPTDDTAAYHGQESGAV